MQGCDDVRATSLGVDAGEADQLARGTERHDELDRLVEVGADRDLNVAAMQGDVFEPRTDEDVGRCIRACH